MAAHALVRERKHEGPKNIAGTISKITVNAVIGDTVLDEVNLTIDGTNYTITPTAIPDSGMRQNLAAALLIAFANNLPGSITYVQTAITREVISVRLGA